MSSTTTHPARPARTLALYRTVGKAHYVLTLRPDGELGLRVTSATDGTVDSDATETFTSTAARDVMWATYVREYTAAGYAEIPGYEHLESGEIRTHEDLLCVTATAAATLVCRKALAAGAARVNFSACYSAAVTSILEGWRRDDQPKWFGYLAEIGAPLVP